MSFQSREISVATGQPVRLYLFERGATRWAYCSADRQITFQGYAYDPVAISDDGIRMTGEASADTLKITAPTDLPPARLFRGAPPSAEIWLTVRDIHYGETDIPGNGQVVWFGSIATVRWPQVDRSEISCQSLGASNQRPGLRLTWDRECPYTVFDGRCGAPRAAFRVGAAVVSLDGAAINVPAAAGYAAGWFSGGWVEWAIDGGEVERRGIESHSGSVLTLLGGTDGLASGMTVGVYPGCDGLIQTCNDKFANTDNCGAIKDLPGKSPFDGNPVF